MQLLNIPIDQILFGTRKREDYGDIEDLALSIRENELINPITVTKQPDGFYKLVAGGRRYTACKYLEHETIACRIYENELSERELRSIEIEENIKRKDFTFLEECSAKRDLLKLQQEIHGEKTSTSPNAEGVSMRDIAKVLGVSCASLSQDIKLAETITRFPQLAWDKCANKREAMELQNRIEETFIRGELAKRAEAAMGVKNIFLNKIINSYQICDCRVGMKELPDGHFDLVEIDPPYAINLQGITRNFEADFQQNHYNEIPSSIYQDLMQSVFTECYRIMSPNSWLICWHAEQWRDQIAQWLKEAKFEFNEIRAVWVKPNGQCNQPNTNLASCYESFFYAHKGNPVLTKGGRNNVFEYNRVHSSIACHPTERPMDMIEEIITLFAMEGSRVLVPFAGSGNTLLAAAKNKMIPLGYDLTDAYRNSFILRAQEMFGKGEE